MTSGFFTKKHVCHDFTWWFHILSWVNQKSCTHRNCGKLLGHVLKVWKPRHWWPMVAFVRWKNAISSLCCSTTCGNWSSWQEMVGGSIARLSNFADIHRLITDVLQLDNDTKKCWFLEEFVAANIMGIVGILHMLSCNRIPILFGQFSRGISMIFDVMFGPKSMKWHDQLWCFPLYFGTHDDRSGWEHHRTMMFGQEVTHRPVGKHILKAA